MAERRVDVLVVDQFENMVYFSGYRSTAAMYQNCTYPALSRTRGYHSCAR
ncbi:hypothetical protein ACIPUD_38900 [Bradyrhizobium sp. CAR08]